MADVKAATLAPCEDEDVHGEIAALCGKLHHSLQAAKILVFWALDKPLKVWGGIKIAPEYVWWSTGGIDGGADILLTLNQELWTSLPRDARTGLLDHFLERVKRKEAGQTEMQTATGMRALYERNESTLGLNDRVMARNPALVQAIKELKRLWKALADPAQFELELQASEEDDPDGDGEGDGDGEEGNEPIVAARVKKGPKAKAKIAAAPLAKEPVVHYYRTANLEEFGPCALRYAEADCQPFDLDGFYFFTDGEQEPADLSTLSYKTDPHALRPVRASLEDEHRGWASEALAKAQPAATA